MFESGTNSYFDNFFAETNRELSAVKDQHSLKKVCAKVSKQLDGVFANELSRSSSTIACCSGCFYCCYLKVDVQPRDAFLIVDFIRGNFSEERQNSILKKAQE